MGALSAEVSESTKRELGENVASGIDDSLRKVDVELAANMNRALESMDAVERESRRLNLVVTGLAEGSVNLEGIERLFEEKFNASQDISGVVVEDSSARATVTLKSWDAKHKILKNKRKALDNSKVYIEEDLSPREQRIGADLRGITRGEKAEGGIRWGHSKLKLKIERGSGHPCRTQGGCSGPGVCG